MHCKNITIFEGADGSGKTTAAKAYAERTGARYVHLAAMPRVSKNLARMYVEVMLPALMGYQDVVIDRCWLSEAPYGSIFREGLDRLTVESRRMLERIAYKCRPVVVYCDPGLETCIAAFSKRRGSEMLKGIDQLSAVYAAYGDHIYTTSLPWIVYDWQLGRDIDIAVFEARNHAKLQAHRVDTDTAGNLGANIVIVGEGYAERKDNDAFYQAPFVSFSGHGCSQWVTGQAARMRSECDLLWMNVDFNVELASLPAVKRGEDVRVIALGDVAARYLDTKLHGSLSNVKQIRLPHPQFYKRFHDNNNYSPLLAALA